MTTPHPVRRTASCSACGGPGDTFDVDDVPSETSCTWCGASFNVSRVEWWCEACTTWLDARPGTRPDVIPMDFERAHRLMDHGYQLLGLAGRPVGFRVTATCDAPGCEVTINRGLAFLCGDRHALTPIWGCGGFYCRTHLDEHRCTGFDDLSMHLPRTEEGEQVCDWDGDVWPCSPVRAAPDNPTIGRTYGRGAA